MSPLLRKRDGSVAYAIHNPDGSWFEMPAQDAQTQASGNRLPASPRQVVTADAKNSAPDPVRQFLRDIGKRGGQARASRHSREQIAAWGRVRHKKLDFGCK